MLHTPLSDTGRPAPSFVLGGWGKLNSEGRRQMAEGKHGNGVRQSKQPRRRWVQRNLAYCLIAPAFLIPLALSLVGVLGNYYSLTDYDIRYGIRDYIGLANYVRAFTKDRMLWQTVWFIVRFTIIVLIAEISLGFTIALALSTVSQRLSRLARTAMMGPLCIAPVIAALMWKIAMGPVQGILNHVLVMVGLPAVNWLGDPRIAPYAVALIDVWIYTPFVVLVLNGGLQSLPRAPYEAAMLDGASAWFAFKKLTLPLLRPFLLIAVLFRACDSLNVFDIIYASTKGGPERVTTSLAGWASENAFRWYQLGYGAALVTILYIIVYAVSRRLLRLMTAGGLSE